MQHCAALRLWMCWKTLPRYSSVLIRILVYNNDEEKMKLPLYPCVVCAQTFTRGSSARRHNSKLHFNQGIIVQMPEYIVGRSCGHFLPPSHLSNRRFRRPIFIKNPKMDNIESGFGATVHEASHRLSNKITHNESYDEFNRVSKLAEIKRLLVQRFGQSASIDRLMHILTLFTSIPEYRNELNKYLAWLRKICRYYDDLMRLAN